MTTTTEQFAEGYHWVVRPADAPWFHCYTREATPIPERDWPEFAGSPYEAVDRPPEGDWEEPDGAGSWKPNMPLLRARRWRQAKDYRDTRARGGCMTPEGPVQTDDASRLKINGAFVAAAAAQAAGQPFSIDWTMADNSVVAHGAGEFVALGMAVVMFMDACQKAAETIRDAIFDEANATAAAIAAIDIEAGYPQEG